MDRSGRLHLLEGASLRTVDVLTSAPPARPVGLAVSPTGEFAAVGHADGHVGLFDLRFRELPRLPDRPLSDLVPRHLELVAAALAEPAASPEARSVLELLQACLEHRFRFDVALGEAVRLAGGDHDVSL